MYKPKIFISHSAHKPGDEEILDRLVNRLEAEGFQVFCDRKRLKVGSAWRNEIYSAIGCCHAAVVLLTKEALDVNQRSWVFQECAMLTLIRGNRLDFPIFPILMTNVTIEDIEDSPFEGLLLTETQTVSYENFDSVLDIIITRMHCLGGCSQEREPLYHYHRRVASHLDSVEKKSLLLDAIESIDSELDQWDPLDQNIPYRLARMVLPLDADKLLDVLQYMLPSLGESETEILIGMIAPFWLDVPAVARLGEVVRDDIEGAPEGVDSPRTAVGINASEQLTGKMYVRRAGSVRKQPYTVITIPEDAGTDDVGRSVRHIITCLRKRMGNPESSDQSIVDKGNQLARQNPYFIVVPYGTDDNVIEQLRNRFRFFIFIILTGQDDPGDYDLTRFRMLEPLLERGNEDRAVMQYCGAMMRAYSYLKES